MNSRESFNILPSFKQFKRWSLPAKASYLGLWISIAALIITISTLSADNEQEGTNPSSEPKEIVPLFEKTDSTRFNVIILPFSSDNSTNFIEETIQNVLFDVSEQLPKTSNVKLYSLFTDKIDPPNSSEEAALLRVVHNADLIIFGSGRMNGCDDKICFKYNFGLRNESSINISSGQYRSDFVPHPIEELSSFPIDGHNLKDWIKLLVHHKSGKTNDALSNILRVADNESLPDSLRAEKYSIVARCYQDFGNYVSSLIYNYKAHHLDSLSADYLFEVARNHMLLGHFEKAIGQYELINSNIPGKIKVLIDLGICYLKIRDYDKAYEVFSEAESVNPENSLVYYNLGLLYYEMGNLGMAIITLEAAIRVDSSHYLPKLALADMLTDSMENRFDEEALEYIDDVMQTHPKHHLPYHLKGRTFYKANMCDSAIVYYSKAVELNPEYINSYMGLSACYRAMGMDSAAQKALGQGINYQLDFKELNPHSSDNEIFIE